MSSGVKVAQELDEVWVYRHRFWYVHLLVFVVPQLLFKYGNTWCFSTAAIESRGARLERIGRQNVCLRKAVSWWTSYDYTGRRSGKKVQRLKTYESSAVEQLLVPVAVQEETWHCTDIFATPEELRLQQQSPTRRLKCDMQEPINRVRAVSVLKARAAAEATA
eukprot:6202130-Pleurochrysis_carterae.AAC.4